MAETETTTGLRIDFSDMPTMRRTDEGYLMREARVARIGVQTYQNGDGTTRQEARLPEHVFAQVALESFAMKPITMGHPDGGLVSAENAARLSVGHVGENIRVDGNWIVMPLVVTDSDTIQRIESGDIVELSGGYRADVEWLEGMYNGQQYDGIQTNIRGNHVALVRQARAGNGARINLDAADAVAVTHDMRSDSEANSMSEKTTTVTLDGIDYQAPPEVSKALQKAEQRADTAEQSVTDAQAEVDKAKARADEAEEKLKTLETERSDEAIQKLVQQRAELERTATRILGDEEELSGKSDREVMESAIKAVHDSIDLSEKSEEYVRARFDAVAEDTSERQDAMASQRAKVNQTVTDGEGYKSDKDYQRDAMNDMRNMHKRDRRKKRDMDPDQDPKKVS